MIVRVSPCGPAMNLSRVQPHLRPGMAALTPTPLGDKERETSGERKWMDGWMLNCYSWIYFFLKTVVSDLSLFPHVYSKQLTSTDEILSLVISED